MKKIIISTIALSALSLASCQKDRTCTCESTKTTNGSGSTSSQSYTVGHATKKEAKRMTDCYSYTQTETKTVFGNPVTTETKVECELK